MTRLTRDAVEGLEPFHQRGGTLQELFLARPGLLALRPRCDADLELDRRTSSKRRRARRIWAKQTAGRPGGPQLRRGDRIDVVTVFRVQGTKLPAGKYRKITGNEATAWGLVCGGRRCGKSLFFSGYPITPASDILHELSMMKNFHVRTMQAEDEIAAMSSVSARRSPAKSQRAQLQAGPGMLPERRSDGPGRHDRIADGHRRCPAQPDRAPGLPTKTEQADLLLAMFGRNSDSPMPIVAAVPRAIV